MRDEERIELYYKFGVLDYKNERNLEVENSKRHQRFWDFIDYVKKLILKIGSL